MARILSTKHGGARFLLRWWFLALLIVPLVVKQTQTLSGIQHLVMQELPTTMMPTNFGRLASKHIVVAHCKEDLSWLNQLYDYDPYVCRRCHIHIYSKCGAQLDLEESIPTVSNCATLHRAMNYGTQEYVFFGYILDMYDSLPSIISFIQGGALTENPHIIHDILGPDLPGMTYRGLARNTRLAWHMMDYEKVEKRGEPDIMSNYLSHLLNMTHWISDWRAMFTVSGAQIRQNPWKAYSFINEKLAHGECNLINCNMEVLFAPFFGCGDAHLFQGASSCTSGTFANLSLVVWEEDYMKDSFQNGTGPSQYYKWKQCGNKTILYSEGTLNGDLICLENPNGMSVETIKHHLEKLIVGDTWKADLTNQTFHEASQWFNHAEILDAQK